MACAKEHNALHILETRRSGQIGEHNTVDGTWYFTNLTVTIPKPPFTSTTPPHFFTYTNTMMRGLKKDAHSNCMHLLLLMQPQFVLARDSLPAAIWRLANAKLLSCHSVVRFLWWRDFSQVPVTKCECEEGKYRERLNSLVRWKITSSHLRYLLRCLTSNQRSEDYI